MHARMLHALALATVTVLLSAGTASAAITVSSPADSGGGSLRQAIADAPPGETIVVPAGTYTLTSDELTIEKSLTIAGHASSDTIIRSGGSFRVFDIAGAGNSVTISGVTIRDGHEGEPGGIAEGGGIRNEKANLTLQSVVVTDNHADVNGDSGGGGGIAEGGGIYSKGGALSLENTLVSGNSATAVGGGGGGGGIVEGGGVAYFGGSSITILSSTISGNVAEARGGSGGGGGIVEGGGAYVEIEPGTAASFSASTIGANVADAGGGSGGGGGIVEGGGLYLASELPSLILSNMTVAGNTARAPGSGADNGGIVEGGGLIIELDLSGTSLTLVSSTIAGNSVDAPGGIVEGGNIDPDPGVKVANSIISGGQGPAGTANCAEKLESQGFNIESANECGLGAAGDKVNIDPQLGPLQNNGGPVPTMAPSFTSPAVDQGSGAGADARGVARPIDFPTIPNAAGGNGSDIGAVELQPSNALSLGKLKLNKKKGTATLTVNLPQPSVGSLTLHGKDLKTQTVAITGQAQIKLKVIGKKKVKKALKKKGKRKVAIEVTYAPTGIAAATAIKKAKLVQKHKKKKHKKKKHGQHKKRH